MSLQEAPPAGLDADVWGSPGRETDLYALWESMVALTQEVKLQGRAFKQLREAVEAPRPPEDPALPLLLDLRERLQRQGAAAREAVQGEADLPWWQRLLPGVAAGARRRREVLESMAEGAALTLGRLEEALGRLGVAEIPALGRPFDPQTMEAVDSASPPGVAEGIVLEVYQAGYLRAGEVLRPARVRVSAPGRNQG